MSGRSLGALPRGGTVLATILLVSACSGGTPPEDPAPGSARSPAAQAEPVPPTPAERLGLRGGWGPTPGELDRAARLTGRLSLPQLAGQVIVASWTGTQAPVAMVRDLHLGGVVAFADNVVSTDQVRALNQRLTREVQRRWPLFLAVDQEGGQVVRVTGDATRFPAFMSAGAAGDTGLTRAAAAASARELRGLGFTVDFAPDADVTVGPADPTIGSRSAGSDPDVVAAHVVAAARGYGEGGVVPVVKHFPGHGSVPADSHLTLPVQTRPLRALRAQDLAPFAAAVDDGLPAVMMGHLDVRAVDPGVPSSLSRPIVTGLLRDELGFEGLVVTDSLQMAAVAGRADPGTIAVRALRAGNDVLLMPTRPALARDGIVRAVRRGDLTRTRLRQAVARQIALLLHTREATPAPPAPPGSGREASRALSAAAVTMVAGPCGQRVVGEAVTLEGSPVAVALASAAAQDAGLGVLLRRYPPSSLTGVAPRPVKARKEPPRRYQGRLAEWTRAERRRVAALDLWQSAEERRLAAGTRIGLTGPGDALVDGEVAVATDTPYVLGTSAAPVRIATYGETPAAMAVLVDVLLGLAPAPGSLPVRVSGLDRNGC